MNPLDLFNTLGLIFGPAVFFFGIFALGMCNACESRRSARRALIFACLPFALGVVASVVGAIIILNAGQQAAGQGMSWFYACKSSLAGLVVTLPPLLWALWLRSRGDRGPGMIKANG
jgi:hypothetical protein